MRKERRYDRAGVVDLEEVLNHLRDPETKSVTYFGHRVKVDPSKGSLRLRTFMEKGLSCSCCGITATHWAVEKNDSYGWHLNLYAAREGKPDMLMTHDHTLARSLGGTDTIDNSTTMCAKCNQNKSKSECRQLCELRKAQGLTTAGFQEKTVGSNAWRKEQAKLQRAEQGNPGRAVHTVEMEYAVRVWKKQQVNLRVA